MSLYSERMGTFTPTKNKIIKSIFDFANGKQIRVLDIGCGTGHISKYLSDHGIYCTAIDKDFLGVPQEETELYHPLECDINELLESDFVFDYDVILFSSVLHEIPNAMEVLFQVVEANQRPALVPVRIIISEPLIKDHLISHKMEKILDSLYEKRTKENKVHRDLLIEYLRSDKIQSEKFYNQDVHLQMLNCAFVEVYGKVSRKREMSQMRYTFSSKDFENWLLGAFPVSSVQYYFIKDWSYERYFKKAGLEKICYELPYTHTISIYDIKW